jgi:general secretion pathway protein K
LAPTQACGRVGGKRAGFALLAVIWGLGVIAMLVVAFLDAGRLRLQTAVNVAAATQAAYVAESAVNRAILALLAGRDRRPPTAETIYDGAPEFCMLDGAAVALGVADEGGKIDLNAAPPELLLAALRAFGIDERNAQDATRGIIAFRTAPSGDPGLFGESPAGDKPTPPKQGLFETVMELDQASGVDPALFRMLLPFVTIHSKAAGVDARASPPALFAALSGYPA